MYSGQIINYIVTPLLNIPMRWTTEIKHVQEGEYFVDEQRFGPYTFWHHKHFFRAVDDGVELIDIVDYALPLGSLGRFAHWLIVERKLKHIFNFRFQKLEKMFGEKQRLIAQLKQVFFIIPFFPCLDKIDAFIV